MVTFEEVTKIYSDGTKAVDSLDLHVQKGECVVFIGPSGCGKTTSLKMINRLEEVSSGRILINGKDIRESNAVKLRRNIGYVIQETGLMPHLTVSENIAMVLHLHKWDKPRIYRRVNELLEMAGLEPDTFKYRLPADMSGGQRQRIGVLRALAVEPDVVLMDEPFGALDPISREHLQGELLDLQEKLHKTIIFVTHDIDEALKLGDRIVLMRGGRVEQVGTPEELKNSPKTAFVRDFIGEDQLSKISPDASISPLIENAPLTVQPRMPASEVLELMEEAGYETAQVVTRRGVWNGMVILNEVKKIARRNGPVDEAIRLNRKLKIEDATIRDAAQMLADRELPIPIIDGSNKLLGLITAAGVARLTIHRLTRSAPPNAAPEEKSEQKSEQGVESV